MLLGDLLEVKSILRIPYGKTNQDKKLLFLIEYASTWIEELLNRVGELEKKERTEYYGGSGTQKLALRARPVFLDPLPRVFVDGNGFYGSTSGAFLPSTTSGGITIPNTELEFGKGFCLALDEGDPTQSRSGILVRIGNFWLRPAVRQMGWLTPYIGSSFGNVKVIYTAGYTTDTTPAPIRAAVNILVAKLNNLFPVGSLLTSEGYEERSKGYFIPHKRILLAEVWPLLNSYRNWSW